MPFEQCTNIEETLHSVRISLETMQLALICAVRYRKGSRELSFRYKDILSLTNQSRQEETGER